MNIDKIRNEALTEDEKMEIIADYLENGGGGGGGGAPAPVLLFVKSIDDLEKVSGSSIYRDVQRTQPVTNSELRQIVCNVDMNNATAPREVWIMPVDSTDTVAKVITGYYDDMASGFFIIFPYGDDLSFYRIYNTGGDDSTTFYATKPNIV